MLTVLVFCFFSLLLLNACKKSTAVTAAAAPQKPIRSLVVTYPTGQTAALAFRQLNYTFATDTVNHSYSIMVVDSVSITNSGSYTLYKLTKTYFLSPDLPRRVLKISFRQGQAGGTDPQASFINYDILFDYDDYTYDPNHITAITYVDLAATQIADQYTYAVGKSASDFYESGATLDIPSAQFYQATRMPLKDLSWVGERGNFIYESYSDSSFEVTETDPNYASALFSFPPFTNPNVAFKYAYDFNTNGQCRTFAIDMLSPDLQSVYGQRKLDFSFTAGNMDLTPIFGQLCFPSSLFWEKVAQQNTPLTLYNLQGDYEYLDPYMPDIYSYQADICSSYTDSVFTIGNTGNRVLFGSNSYTNKSTRDSQGNILTLTKYDGNNLIIRSITVGY